MSANEKIARKISQEYFNKNKINDFKYIRIIAMIYITFLLAATVAAYRIVIIGPFQEPGSTLIFFSECLCRGLWQNTG